MPRAEEAAASRREESRDREVARGTARCIGMVAATTLATAVVERRSRSMRTDRPSCLLGTLDAESRSFLLVGRMMSQVVETSRNRYGSEVWLATTRPLSVGARFHRSRIQEASR